MNRVGQDLNQDEQGAENVTMTEITLTNVGENLQLLGGPIKVYIGILLSSRACQPNKEKSDVQYLRAHSSIFHAWHKLQPQTVTTSFGRYSSSVNCNAFEVLVSISIAHLGSVVQQCFYLFFNPGVQVADV